MSVNTFLQTNYAVQPLSTYFPAVDANTSVVASVAAAFAPHENDPSDLTVVVDTGSLFTGGALVTQPSQVTSAFSIPASSSRIDRIVIGKATGLITVVQGTEASSPTPPAIPTNSLPIAQVSLTPATMQITNAAITDERPLFEAGSASGGLIGVQVFGRGTAVYTPAAGTKAVIVEVMGGGGGGGGCAATGSTQGSASSGGSAGSFAKGYFTSDFSGVTVTVGAGGAASTAAAVVGNDGEASSFGNLVSAPGGIGGFAGPAYTPPALVGERSPGALPSGGNLVSAQGGPGGAGLVLSATVVFSGAGGSSAYGGGGHGSGNSAPGAGSSPGSGGGGASVIKSTAARAGGAGADGMVTIYEFG